MKENTALHNVSYDGKTKNRFVVYMDVALQSYILCQSCLGDAGLRRNSGRPARSGAKDEEEPSTPLHNVVGRKVPPPIS